MTNKILLFNGCSFVAGDDIAWNYNNGPFPNSGDEYEANKDYFHTVRSKSNLAAITQRLINSPEKIDLSADGNNNTEIALYTIGYLMNEPVERRKQFHVCIGWTEPIRLCKYSNTHKQFVSLGPWMADSTERSEWHQALSKEIKSYASAIFDKFYDIDILLEFMKNVMLLENYLKSEGIPYTFWRSLGHTGSPEDIQQIEKSLINTMWASNKDAWIKFNTSNRHPLFNESLISVLFKDPSKYLTPNNHPNTYAATQLAEQIAAHIL